MRNFDSDLNTSNSQEIREEWQRVLTEIFDQEVKINFDDAMNVQKGHGVDLTLQLKSGRRYSVELKTKRFDYYENNKYTLEIFHHLYKTFESELIGGKKRYKGVDLIKTKEGWLYNTTAEYLFFATLNESKDKIIEVCGFTLIPFKNEEFKSNLNNQHKVFAYTFFKNGNFQTTGNILVDKDWLQKYANKYWYKKV